MKINPEFRITATPQPQKTCSNAPNFGIKFKPVHIKDLFVKSVKGLQSLNNIKRGEYGTICKGSKPLPNFYDEFSEKELKQACKRGISTNTESFANCFLKSSAQKPLSTSSVHDCSVMYLFNEKTNTHFMFHSYYKNTEDYFENLIKTFMKEGFSKAYILPGDNAWTERHPQTMHAMFNAIKKLNQTAKLEVYHNSSKLPEIVGYKGKVFEIPNRIVMLGFEDGGQASFKICDLQNRTTMNKIKAEGISSENLDKLELEFCAEGYDEEILKILKHRIEERRTTIQDIEACTSIEELKELMEFHKPSFVSSNIAAFDMKKQKLLAEKRLNNLGKTV